MLAEKCYGCHSVEAEGRKKLKGGLYLDSKAGVLVGGKDGVVLIPGDAEKSRLIHAIRYGNDDTAMPPKEKLSAAVVADFTAWVAMGAPDPRVGDQAPKVGAAIAEQAKKHWAFQPVIAPPVPSVKKASWATTDMDRFILAKLEAAKITPAKMADKRTWLRRATFDVIGLPPTSAEIAAFEIDQTPSAFVTVIDRLLASPAYGERWGRHWLDVARYADSKGGHVHGATDEFGFKAVVNPVHVHDLQATILRLMGFDHERFTFRYAGRDFRLTDVHGKVAKGVIA